MKCELLTEKATLTIHDLSIRCQIKERDIIGYVEQGFILAVGDTPESWRFSDTSIVFLQKANRLQKDLGLNPAGVALAFELLSEIDELKKQLKRIKGS